MIQPLAFLVIALSTAAHAAIDFVPCEQLYEARAQLAAVERAYSCFAEQAQQALQEGENAARRRALEKLLLSGVWIVNKNRPEDGAPDTEGSRQTRLRWIQQSLNTAEALIKEFPDAGSGYYWRAVFVSFDCREAGFGAKGIACIFKALGAVEKDLNESLRLDPNYHGAGTERVLAYKGLSEYQFGKPGSSLTRPSAYAKSAYERAPRCTLNALAYAKILLAQKKMDAARSLLEKVIALDPRNPTEVDPAFFQEAVNDQIEARTLLEKLGT